MTSHESRVGPGLAIAAGFAYPVAAHLAILSGHRALIVASVALLCVLLLLEPLRRGRPWAWLLVLAAIAALWRLGDTTAATLPLFAPPVLITAGVAWLFGRTLRPGATPLVEQFARVMEGAELGEEQRRYARKLTAAWAWLTGVLSLVNFTLALFAVPSGLLAAAGIVPPVAVPLEVWSLFANVINYLVLGAMFAAEFAYRRHRFPDRQHGRLVDFIRGIVRLGPVLGRRRADP